MDFAKWLDNFCPAQSERRAQPHLRFLALFLCRLLYATSWEGAAHVRPWMLGLRGDFSVSGGFVEPDVAALMMQLFLTEGQLAAMSRQASARQVSVEPGQGWDREAACHEGPEGVLGGAL